MSKSEQERRGSKRVDSKLQFKAALSGADGDVRLSSFETVNLSISGLYFKSDLPLEPMTRFELEIMFPNGKGTAGEAGGLMSVKGEGTVVWSAPDVDDPKGSRFEVGVFFSRLDLAGKKRLAAHVAGAGQTV